MTLPSLSPYLRLIIAKHLDPISSFNYAIACKEHWSLNQLIIQEHKQLFARWSVLDVSEKDTVPCYALKEVLLNPRIAWYIKELNMPAGWYYDPNFYVFKNRPNPEIHVSEDDMQLFRDAAQALVPLYASRSSGSTEIDQPHSDQVSDQSIAEILGEQLYQGNTTDAIIAILIHYLPYLETLRVTVDDQVEYLRLVIERIALESRDGKNAARLPLRRLKTIAIAHYDSEGSCSPEWVLRSLSLPFLRTFAASAMGGHIGEGPANRIMSKEIKPLSNIKELYLFRCQFEVSTLDNILSGIKALEIFTYQCAGGIVSENWSEPKHVIELLARHTAHSLETLFLDHDCLDSEHCEIDATSVSLRALKKLQILTCNWKMLWPEESVDMGRDEALNDGFYRSSDTIPDLDIRETLPESLQELYLTGDFDEEDREWERLTQPFGLQNDATPNLVKIRVSGSVNGSVSIQVPRESKVFTLGNAQEPSGVYAHPLFTLFEGHGY